MTKKSSSKTSKSTRKSSKKVITSKTSVRLTEPSTSPVLSHLVPFPNVLLAKDQASVEKPTAIDDDSAVAEVGVLETPELSKSLASSESVESADEPEALQSSETFEQPEPIPTTEPEDELASPSMPSDDALVPTDPAPKSVSDIAQTTKSFARMSRRRSVVVVALMLAVIGGLLWINHTTRNDQDGNSANQKLITEIAQRAVLPNGEKPTVTTVVDKRKANQTFLVNAANGDKVLLYLQSGRAVLYRPSTHQIVNMGPLTQPPAQVFLRNGASGDIPPSIREKLTSSPGFTIVSQDLSTKTTYTRTLVVDLTGNRPDLAARVAKNVGGVVAKLPREESRPDAEILVIVGSDAKL